MDLAELQIHKEINAKSFADEPGSNTEDNLSINSERPINFDNWMFLHRSKSCSEPVLLSLVPGIL
jgi:hypothetical protein